MKTIEIGAFAAKTHLSKLLNDVRKGKVYHITKHGRPVAELRPVASGGGRTRFGCDSGRILITPDFDAPLPDFKDLGG